MSIPKIIHFFYDEDLKLWQKDKKPQFRMCYLSWLRYCPDYKIMHWHDKMPEFQEMLKQSKFLQECYKQKIWAFVSDYVRAYALNKYGGIYLDTDVQVLKSFDKYLEKDFFTSIEGDIIQGHNIPEPAVLAGKKGHKVFAGMLKIYQTDEIYNQNDIIAPHIAYSAINKLTNFTKLPYKTIELENNVKHLYDKNKPLQNLENIEQYLGQDIFEDKNAEITIYPCQYFCPDWSHMKNKSITDKTVCIHWNQGSWWGSKKDDVKMQNVRMPHFNRLFCNRKIRNKMVTCFLGIKITRKIKEK